MGDLLADSGRGALEAYKVEPSTCLAPPEHEDRDDSRLPEAGCSQSLLKMRPRCGRSAQRHLISPLLLRERRVYNVHVVATF